LNKATTKYHFPLYFIERVLNTLAENIALRNEKFFMIMTGGIILDHHVSVVGIKVDLDKIDVIVNMLHPTNQKGD
jgi:hypothetical protein